MDDPMSPTWQQYQQEQPDHVWSQFRALRHRDAAHRSLLAIQRAGRHDPARDGTLADYPPLTRDERLRMLAMGEAIARDIRQGGELHLAVLDGATWEQIGAAIGAGPDTVRDIYRTWVKSARRSGFFGDAEHAAALAVLDQPTGERPEDGS